MLNKRERPVEVRGKKIACIVLFWTGVVAIIVSVVCVLSAWGNGNFSALILFYISAPIGVLFVFIGMILFFVWKREVKLQCNADQSKNPRL